MGVWRVGREGGRWGFLGGVGKCGQILGKIGSCLPKRRRAGRKTRLTAHLCLLVTSSTHNLDGSEELLRAVRIAIPVNYGRASSRYLGGRGVGCHSRRPVSLGFIFVLVITPFGLSVLSL